MASKPQLATDYVLGSSEEEQRRLILQASILRSWTERFFRAAGIVPGMRVLDLGCGMGDVSFLAAELVGPTGSVIGIDRDSAVIDQARKRGAALDNVTFVTAAVGEYQDSQPFDAVVGRYILLYQPDPAATLRKFAASLRSGGVMVFHEMDFANPLPVYPEPPLWKSTYALLTKVFRCAGAHPELGLRLTRTFLDAGLPWPSVLGELPVGGGPGSYLYPWLAETIRSLLPRIEQFGIATVAEIQIETLAQRMEAEAVALGSQVIGPPQFGAWVRL